MKNSSTYRILYLLNLLNQKDYTKNEIVEEFSKIGEKITKPSINSYIKKLLENNIDIKVLNNKSSNVYHLETPEPVLKLTDYELKSLDEIKKVVIAQKDYNKIRKFIRILYKFVLNVQDEQKAHRFFDFGYYSNVNWGLVRKLETHCKNKDLIEIDYMLPLGKNRKITIYPLELKIVDWSDRLYLWGVFENANQISYLPVDKIFMITKVKKKNCPFDFKNNILTYAISKALYEETELNSSETLVKLTDKYAFIQRKIIDEFYLVQRLMSFCPDLYYISDERIKNLVKEKLLQVKSNYEKEYE
mgnify:CR=1 FL=1